MNGHANCLPALTARRRPQWRRGFTLVEILGVVVILGIASAILIPQISSRDDQKASSAARVVVADLMYAQNRAIATQRTHYVAFDTAANVYRIYEVVPSASSIIKHPVTGQNYQVQFGPASADGLKQMSIASANFDTQTVLAFDALGVPYSYNATLNTLAPLSAGSVGVRSGTYQLTVSVAPFSGELTVQ